MTRTFLSYVLRSAAGLLMAATVLVAPAAAGGSDPKVVLDEIFQQVDGMCGGDGNGPAYDIAEIAKTYFAPNLAKPFEAAMESGSLDFDVLVDGQDCKTTDLELTMVESGETSAKGRATFKNMGEARVIDLVMMKSGDAWKVADIVYEHRPFSLRKSL
jgi:hypothetical protein